MKKWFGVVLITAFPLAACAPAAPPYVAVASPTASISQGRLDAATAQRLISQHRAAHGLGAVVIDPALQRVAQGQANSMASLGQLSHGPQPLGSRLSAQGLWPRDAVENVSAGYGSLDRVIAAWQRSPSHNSNLLVPGMRRMGIAMAQGPNTRFRTYWALVMAD